MLFIEERAICLLIDFRALTTLRMRTNLGLERWSSLGGFDDLEDAGKFGEFAHVVGRAVENVGERQH